MRTTVGLLACFVLLSAGCRGGRNEIVERELRLQEDKIFQLEDMVDQCHAMLESSRRENEALKQHGDSSASDSTSTGSASGPSLSVPPGISGTSRDGDDFEPLDLQPPKIESGVPTDGSGPSIDAPRAKTPAAGTAFRDEPPSDERLDRIVINKQLTGGRDAIGDHQDEGLMVVFEPRGASGRWVQALGDVSIVVLDPTKRGAESRVARWNFTADEAAAHFRKSALGRGFHFELPWPSKPPTSRSLKLYVRLRTPEGEKFIAEATVPVDPPGGHGDGWARAPGGAQSQPAETFTPDVKISDRRNQQPPSPGERRSVLSKAPPARTSAKGRRPAWSPNR